MFGDVTTLSDVRQILAKQESTDTNELSVWMGLEQFERFIINSLNYLMTGKAEHFAGAVGCEDTDAELGERTRMDEDLVNLEDANRPVGVNASHDGCDEKKIASSCEENEPSLMDLPDSVLLHMFSFLNARDIANIGCTCRHGYSLCADQLLWRDMLNKEKLRWHRVGHKSNPVSHENINSDVTYKEIYMRCSPEFQRETSSSRFLKLPKLLWSLIPHKPPKVVMFGPGIESNSTTLVRTFLGSGSDTFRVRGVFPALLPGVGTGFTVSVNGKIDMQLITLYSGTKRDRERANFCGTVRAQRNKLLQMVDFSDEGEEMYEPTATIKELCRKVDAFIFVVDALVGKETTMDCPPELFALMDDRWTAPKIPLVILSCVPNLDTPRVPCVTMAERLGLHKLNRPWEMFDVTVSDMTGVVNAITWLVESA